MESRRLMSQRHVKAGKPQNSTEFKVSLQDVTLTSSGMFTCEVISDENFETFRESANMTVIGKSRKKMGKGCLVPSKIHTSEMQILVRARMWWADVVGVVEMSVVGVVEVEVMDVGVVEMEVVGVGVVVVVVVVEVGMVVEVGVVEMGVVKVGVVLDPPDHAAGHTGPEIQVSGWGGSGPVEVQEGQQVEAECVARGANPPVHLTWFINDTEVPRQYVTPQSSRLEGLNTYTTVVRLQLPARERWDSQGRLHLRCDAEIPGLYRESSVLELHNPVFRRLQQSGYFSAGSSLHSSPLLLAWAVMVVVGGIQALERVGGGAPYLLPQHPNLLLQARPPPPRS
ncbi:hypothetical protein GWK47_009961 [Chionoecetes opilio]|uniref:Ig-like domain-containing protein n=1 Tax=Chionoecetes opilio TaxID=41210 RepID=A0A8J4Y359_CHIOP|nr:hypothetical protein GWK47_009961 [Chionoecetes opilio]